MAKYYFNHIFFGKHKKPNRKHISLSESVSLEWSEAWTRAPQAVKATRIIEFRLTENERKKTAQLSRDTQAKSEIKEKHTIELTATGQPKQPLSTVIIYHCDWLTVGVSAFNFFPNAKMSSKFQVNAFSKTIISISLVLASVAMVNCVVSLDEPPQLHLDIVAVFGLNGQLEARSVAKQSTIAECIFTMIPRPVTQAHFQIKFFFNFRFRFQPKITFDITSMQCDFNKEFVGNSSCFFKSLKDGAKTVGGYAEVIKSIPDITVRSFRCQRKSHGNPVNDVVVFQLNFKVSVKTPTGAYTKLVDMTEHFCGFAHKGTPAKIISTIFPIIEANTNLKLKCPIDPVRIALWWYRMGQCW